MSSLHKITLGKHDELIKLLANSGLDLELALWLLHNKECARDMIATLKWHKSEISLVHDMFTPPDVQLHNVRKWNAVYKWGFSEKQINEMALSIPQWPNKPSVAVMLVPYLNSMYFSLWQLLSVIPKTYDIKLDTDVVLDFIKNFQETPDDLTRKELRWEIIDLGAFQNQRGVRFIKGHGCIFDLPGHTMENLPHMGVIAAAMHHPKWLKSLNEENIPGVKILGFHVKQNTYKDNHPTSNPIFSFSSDYTSCLSIKYHEENDRMRIDVTPMETLLDNYAIPVFYKQ